LKLEVILRATTAPPLVGEGLPAKQGLKPQIDPDANYQIDTQLARVFQQNKD